MQLRMVHLTGTFRRHEMTNLQRVHEANSESSGIQLCADAGGDTRTGYEG